jgi:mRNA interferase MazF
VLAQLGLDGKEGVEMTIEDGALVLRRPASPTRTGWPEAARCIAEAGDDELVMACVVVSPSEMHDHLPTVLVAPMTTAAREAPFRIGINHGGRKGLILLDQVRAVDKTRLAKKLGVVSAKTLTATLRTLQEVFAE